MYMFTQNFIKLSAVVHELLCSEIFVDAENSIAVNFVGSNKKKEKRLKMKTKQ